MGRQCDVKCCYNKQSSAVNITLFKAPKCAEGLNKWSELLNSKITLNSYACEEHFNIRDAKSTEIVRDAVGNVIYKIQILKREVPGKEGEVEEVAGTCSTFKEILQNEVEFQDARSTLAEITDMHENLYDTIVRHKVEVKLPTAEWGFLCSLNKKLIIFSALEIFTDPFGNENEVIPIYTKQEYTVAYWIHYYLTLRMQQVTRIKNREHSKSKEKKKTAKLYNK